MSRKYYDFVCSIGHYCATAMYLKRHFLRSMSGPLDWIGMEPDGLRSSLKLINDNFAGLLELKNLKFLPERMSDGDGVNGTYLDEGTGMLVFHDYPLKVPLKESHASVKAKYDRRISRFYEKLDGGGRVLLVFHTRIEHPDVLSVLPEWERIRARFPKTHIDLLIIEHVEGLATIEESSPAPGIRHLRGPFYRPEIHNVLGDIALCDRVYIAIPNREAERIRRRQKHELFLARLLAFPHLSGSVRHETFQRWMNYFEARHAKDKKS